MKQISLAVTAYEESTRGEFSWIKECIAPAVADPRVREITVTNDGTPDFDALADEIADLPKVRLIQNPGRLHVFGNKLESVYQSTSEWVLLCDSDNVMPASYYRALEGQWSWNPDRWYSTSYARPAFNYRPLIGVWDLGNVEKMLTHLCCSCFMNTGNQFVHRQRFLDVFGHLRGKRFDLEQPTYFEMEDRTEERWFLAYGAADSYFLMKTWLLAGCSVHCVPGLEYDHRVGTGKLSNFNRAPTEKERITPAYMLELLDAARGEKHTYQFVDYVNRLNFRYRREDGKTVVIHLHGKATVE